MISKVTSTHYCNITKSQSCEGRKMYTGDLMSAHDRGKELMVTRTKMNVFRSMHLCDVPHSFHPYHMEWVGSPTHPINPIRGDVRPPAGGSGYCKLGGGQVRLEKAYFLGQLLRLLTWESGG